jgi:methyltransferase-like protein
LLTCYALNLVKLYTHPPHFVLEPGECPQASALARLQTRQGRAVTNLAHEVIVLSDDLSYYLLPYLDGQHGRAALLEVLEDLTTQGVVVVDSSGGDSRREFLGQTLEQCLRQLGQNALLVA